MVNLEVCYTIRKSVGIIMNEEIIWSGRPSQLTNLLYFIATSLTIILPIYRYLQTRFTIYSLSETRITLTVGILSQTINETELYRIRDYMIHKPFFLRIFGLGNLELRTSEKTQTKENLYGILKPKIIFHGIKNPENLKNLLRDKVEIARKKTGTKEVDFT
jgi:uncharacterized membrane protein YdbT with pleckstrin-like domain